MAVAAGSAQAQGALWGARARDWAEVQEPAHLPLYRAVFERLGVGPDTDLLDVGCGSGLACALARERGARVSGIDAAAPLIDIARKRVPGGEFETGEMEVIPFRDRSFSAVTGFNSFQYAARPANALAEARRLACNGAPVVMVTWGDPRDCEAAAYLSAVGRLLPPPPPGAGGPFALSDEGALGGLAREAGLRTLDVEDVDCPFIYPDRDTALRGLLSAGPVVKAIQASGEAAVRDAVSGAIEPFRRDDGTYRMENKFRYLLAVAA